MRDDLDRYLSSLARVPSFRAGILEAWRDKLREEVANIVNNQLSTIEELRQAQGIAKALGDFDALFSRANKRIETANRKKEIK